MSHVFHLDRCTIAFGFLDRIEEGYIYRIVSVCKKVIGNQKNWSFVRDLRHGRILMLTDVSPNIRMAVVNYRTGTVKYRNDEVKYPGLAGLRCTSPAIPWTDSTYLTLLHTHLPYSTVLAEFDEVGNFYRWSRPLYLGGRQRSIEFPIGLAQHQQMIILGLGLDDAVSSVRMIPRSTIEKLLVNQNK